MSVDVDDRVAQTRRLLAEIRTAGGADAVERDRLLTELTDLYAPVVSQLARRYGRRGVDHDELCQVAYIGLMKAINNYDLDRADLMPYAVATMLGEIKRYFRDRCWAIRPTRRVQELELRLAGGRAALEQDLGRHPTVLELADHLGEDPEDVSVAMQSNSLFRLLSTDAAVDGTASGTLGDRVAHDDAGFSRAEASAMIRAAVSSASLSERDRQIVRMRFFDDMTQREIAAVIGTTQMQVSRILTRTLAALRATIGPLTA